MNIYECVMEMKQLERRLTLYEEKYGVLSEDFYTALMSGELSRTAKQRMQIFGQGLGEGSAPHDAAR